MDEADADGVRLSIGVQSLGGATLTGEPVVVGSSEVYFSASLVKLALVAAVLRQVDRGELSLDQVETVTGGDVVGGAGELARYPMPYDASVAELSELAITVSDNTASNVLAELVGLDAVDTLVDDLGVEPTHMGRLFFSAGPRSEGNRLDTASTVELMRALFEDDVLSPASRELMLGWMRDQQMDTKVAPALAGVPVASKTGDAAAVSHVGAYLLEPGRETVLVVLSETEGEDRLPSEVAAPYIAEAARRVHRQVAAAPPAPGSVPVATRDATSDDGEGADPTAGEDDGGGAEDADGDGGVSAGLVGTAVGLGVVVLVVGVAALARRRRQRARG